MIAAWDVGDVNSSYEGEVKSSVDVQLMFELQYDRQTLVDISVVYHVGRLNLHQRVINCRRAAQRSRKY